VSQWQQSLPMRPVQSNISMYVCAVWPWSAQFAIQSLHILKISRKLINDFDQNQRWTYPFKGPLCLRNASISFLKNCSFFYILVQFPKLNSFATYMNFCLHLYLCWYNCNALVFCMEVKILHVLK
jgi:hypothetical protein